MSVYQRNVLVGIVVLVGLGMLGWMILQFANKAASFFLTSGTKITLTASVAGGLSDGSAVTYKGVHVGRVTSVRLGEHERVIVDALIQKDAKVPANVHGKIKQTSLLGGSAMIELEPDPLTTSRPTAAGGLLTEGANLRAESTADITSLGDELGKLSISLQQTVAAVNEIIGDPKVKDDIKASLTNARQTLENANKVALKLENISLSLEKSTNAAGETLSDVRSGVKDARGEIKRISDNLNQRLEQLAESLQSVKSVTLKIDQGKGTAGQLVNDPKLYDSLADTAAEMNLMVKDMRRLIQQWEQEGIVKF